MDTTAAAELGAVNNNYWAVAPQQEEPDDDEDDDFDDGRGAWTTPDYRQASNSNRSNGGEPPLKKTRNGSVTAFTPPQQGFDAFEPSANSETTGQGASSGTPPPPEASGASSGGGGKSNSNGRPSFGKMFFKTKLCCKFRAGTCPYLNNCNFAHGMEELRKPPPNWQEIVAQQEELSLRAERWSGDSSNHHHHHRQQSQMPTVVTSPSEAVVLGGGGGDGTGGGSGSSHRFHKTRFCKKYYTEDGCPYGDTCNFLHDDQGRSRESVAISLGPTSSNGGGNEFVVANGGGSSNGGGANGASQRPMYWKTRICNKWETTGHCPFGDKCHFAHGVAELQKYGGGLLDSENGATSGGLRNDFKQTASSMKPHTEPGVGPQYSVFNTDNYTMGISNQRSIGNIQGQRQGQRAFPKWKGPDKISQIYGDWIDDNEWEYTNHLTVLQPEEASQIHEEEPQDARVKKIEKLQNKSQGQTNIPFFKGIVEQHNNRNRFSKGGSKGRDVTSLGANFDQVYEDDTLVGEL